MIGHRQDADPQDRPFRGVNVAILDDGREVHVDDIATNAEGRAIIDEIEAATILIATQLEFDTERDDAWRKRATLALRRKRAVLSRLQQRVAELRRAEKAAAVGANAHPAVGKADAKRFAFIEAAHEHLGVDTCIKIWALAKGKQPALFADDGGAE